METHVTTGWRGFQHGNSIKLDGNFINNFHLEIGIISSKSSAIESIQCVRMCVCFAHPQVPSSAFSELSNFYLIIFIAFFMNVGEVGRTALGMMTSCLRLYDAYSVQPFDIIHDAINVRKRQNSCLPASPLLIASPRENVHGRESSPPWDGRKKVLASVQDAKD